MEAKLKAQPRSEMGSQKCRAIRAQGMIPAVLYGSGGDCRALELESVEVEAYFRNIKSQHCHLEVQGQGQDVVIQEVQRHPVSRAVLHMDFKRC